jgi:3-phenylpropionate/trans-cinnamate dioxygenase ferredoxin reductase subunit
MHIAIIGNGIAGITAARFIRKLSDHRITVISAETDYFFSRTALMYIYMGHMRYEDTQPYENWFWEKNRIDLLRAYVKQINFETKTLHFQEGRPPLSYDKLLIATGSASNKFGWPGQDLEAVRGLYSYQDLEYMETYSQNLERAVIVGGGLIGIEMGEMFHSRNIPVTFLVRESSYWDNVLPREESEMISRHIREHHFDLHLGTELKEIIDDGSGKAGAVVTNQGETISCGFVGLTAGVHPNIDFVRDSSLETEKGILVNAQLETNIADVYAAGDCAQIRDPLPGRRPIEAVWYAGRMMGETAAYNICGTKIDYDPGVWFNSAKFLDIEYQVYGDVPPQLPDHYQSLYWEHPDGRKSIRINYEKEGGAVRGFNLMGIRYRQEVCEKWIRERTHIEEVLKRLSLANFDPEFFKEYEEEVIALYNQQTGSNLKLREKRKLDRVLQFLGKR